jgi:putative ABC transport system permease protein
LNLFFGPEYKGGGCGKIKYSSTYEIVGVVNDMRYLTYDYNDPVRPMYWLPEAQTLQFDDPAFASGVRRISHF